MKVELSKDELVSEYLLKNKLVSKEMIFAANKESEITEEAVGNILVSNGFLAHDDLINALLQVTNKNLVHEEVIIAHIDPEILRSTRTKIAAQTIKKVFLATMSDEMEVRYNLAKEFPQQEIEFINASPESIEDYLDKLDMINNSEDSVLETMLREAIANGVSDIHIIPRKNSYSVFYRHLGVRTIVKEGDLEEYITLIARIKNKAKVDIAEKRIPLDGGFYIEYNGRIVDLRVGTVPTISGEVCVMRILDPANANRKVSDIGITNLDGWMKGCRRINGLCLVVGPTGSGKTTTLNSTAKELDRFGKAIYTVEDPVEYQLPYISQVNINVDVGLDFARALKAFLRLDPDVIILGEIRDENTARNAVQAAETGHLVFATLHAGSIKGCVGRLRDLKVPVHELKGILRSVLAQSLLRTVCSSCHGDCRRNPSNYLDENACKKCLNTGYSGRTIISECHYFENEEEVEEMLAGGSVKWRTVIEDAYYKYVDGVTDYDEFIRVFDSQGLDMIAEKGTAEQYHERALLGLELPAAICLTK